jgi:hypothetical protein
LFSDILRRRAVSQAVDIDDSEDELAIAPVWEPKEIKVSKAVVGESTAIHKRRETALAKGYERRERAMPEKYETREKVLAERYQMMERALKEEYETEKRILNERYEMKERKLAEAYEAKEKELEEKYQEAGRRREEVYLLTEAALADDYETKEKELVEEHVRNELSLTEELVTMNDKHQLTLKQLQDNFQVERNEHAVAIWALTEESDTMEGSLTQQLEGSKVLHNKVVNKLMKRIQASAEKWKEMATKYNLIK